MVWMQYTATRSQRAATACLFLTGAALIVAAARLSYANIEPQRAKAAERRRVLEAFIRRKLGSDSSSPQGPIAQALVPSQLIRWRGRRRRLSSMAAYILLRSHLLELLCGSGDKLHMPRLKSLIQRVRLAEDRARKAA
ncbi:hypothetical protein EJB05_19107, partial [Eragrostis curvula]